MIDLLIRYHHLKMFFFLQQTLENVMSLKVLFPISFKNLSICLLKVTVFPPSKMLTTT